MIVDELVEDLQMQGFDRSREFLVIRDIPGGLDIRVREAARQRRKQLLQLQERYVHVTVCAELGDGGQVSRGIAYSPVLKWTE
jgi:hypothetical protein